MLADVSTVARIFGSKTRCLAVALTLASGGAAAAQTAAR